MKHERLDRFGVENMGEAEFKKKQVYVEKNCKCKGCPTYVAGDTHIGYCFPTFGTSTKIHLEKNCICATCPIYKEHELNLSFYCTRCSQFCQTMKIEGPTATGA